MLEVKVFKTTQTAKTPQKANPLDACYDVYADLEGRSSVKNSLSFSKVENSPHLANLLIVKNEERKSEACVLTEGDKVFINLPPNSSTLIPTGIIFDVPEGYRMDANARSGNAFKRRLFLTNGVGVIDA